MAKARRGLTGRMRARAEIAGLTALLLACGTVAALEVAPAIADPHRLIGGPVPDGDVQTIVSAALSCPSLTPPKLAAQLMENSGFANRTAGGVKGVAGLTDEQWQRWKPWSYARRGDRQANIVALAHGMCETVGQLRAANLTGDLWKLAIAAARTGPQAVLDAHGVPAQAARYTDRVASYAVHYAREKPFRIEAPTTPRADPGTSLPVPDVYLADINAAGRICPAVTPARVAAQLRAASGFNPNLRSSSGAEGIAQFPARLWNSYRTGADTSVWRPADAISALGAALCDLTNQFSGLGGADPYSLAVGAFQWGPDVIRQAGGLPRANLTQLPVVVQQHVPEYERDPRLTVSAAKPRPTVSVKPGSSPAPTPSSAATPRSSSPGATTRPSKRATAKPNVTYQIESYWAHAIVEARGVDDNHKDGDRIDIADNKHQKDQYWRMPAAPVPGYVLITNAYNNMSLSTENSSTDNLAKIVHSVTNRDDPHQHWRIEDAGNGTVRIFNRASGKAMDLLGEDRDPPFADGTSWNTYFVQQYDVDPTAQDMLWILHH
ncbi:RICIN domain-containing protein [Actinoplanes sp. NPDC051470]|uniref:RICIN domain-containing protein n=1 Tax=unclassified Actinoplanes TaxID=2626549 RepID=UPI00342790FE